MSGTSISLYSLIRQTLLAAPEETTTHALGRLPIENRKTAITIVPYIDCVVRLTYSTPLSWNDGSSIDEVRITYFHKCESSISTKRSSTKHLRRTKRNSRSQTTQRRD